MSAIPVVPSYLPTVAHAVDLVTDLGDGLPDFVAVAGTCGRGWAHDLTLFTGADAVVDVALDWGCCVAAMDAAVSGIVLLSAEPDLAVVSEEDLAWWSAHADVIALDGIELIDWVRSDGRRVRSMAQLLGADRPVWFS